MNLIATMHLLCRNILRQLFRKKGSILLLFVLPVVGLLVPIFMFSSVGAGVIRIGVNDLDQSAISLALTAALSEQSGMSMSETDGLDVEQALAKGTLEVMMDIPAGFGDSLIAGTPLRITIRSVQGASVTGWVTAFTEFYLGSTDLLRTAAQGDADAFKSMFSDFLVHQTEIGVHPISDTTKGMNITWLGLGFLIQFMLINAGRTASLILEERRDRTLARIRVSPVKSEAVVAANVLVNVLVVTVQVLLSLLVLKLVFHVDSGVPLWQMLLLMIPLNVAGVGICLMLVSLAKDLNQLNLLLTIFVYPTCLLSGCFWDVTFMPPMLQQIAWLFPQRWALDGVQRLSGGDSFASVGINILVLAAFSLAFYAVAVFGFSRSDPSRA